MFRRRKSLSLVSRLRTIVWPARGFGRLFSYLAQRVMRMPGSSASIAVGLACGVAVSFTPFLGFHLLFGAMLAYLMRGNLIASGIGTIVGNPWTFPFIFLANYEVGLWILNWVGMSTPRQAMSLNEFSANPMDLVLPLAVGGMTMGIVAWFSCFGMAYWALQGWREHRQKRLAAGRERRFAKAAANQNETSEPTDVAPETLSASDMSAEVDTVQIGDDDYRDGKGNA